MSTPAAFINALMEEGTKQDCLVQLVKLWDENCDLRKKIQQLEAQIDHLHWANTEIRKSYY